MTTLESVNSEGEYGVTVSHLGGVAERVRKGHEEDAYRIGRPDQGRQLG